MNPLPSSNSIEDKETILRDIRDGPPGTISSYIERGFNLLGEHDYGDHVFLSHELKANCLQKESIIKCLMNTRNPQYMGELDVLIQHCKNQIPGWHLHPEVISFAMRRCRDFPDAIPKLRVLLSHVRVDEISKIRYILLLHCDLRHLVRYLFISNNAPGENFWPDEMWIQDIEEVLDVIEVFFPLTRDDLISTIFVIQHDQFNRIDPFRMSQVLMSLLKRGYRWKPIFDSLDRFYDILAICPIDLSPERDRGRCDYSRRASEVSKIRSDIQKVEGFTYPIIRLHYTLLRVYESPVIIGMCHEILKPHTESKLKLLSIDLVRYLMKFLY